MTVESTDDLIMLSELQHFVFCPRQCALIHIEQLWAENVLTVEGRIMHDKGSDITPPPVYSAKCKKC